MYQTNIHTRCCANKNKKRERKFLTFQNIISLVPQAVPPRCLFVLPIKHKKMSLTESSAADIAKTASLASRRLATLPGAARNEALTVLHQALLDNRNSILAANARDVEAASRAAENGNLSQSVLKRLDLSRPGKFADMLQGILSVRDLSDPGKLSEYISLRCADKIISRKGEPENPAR